MTDELEPERRFTVRYQFATYSGERTVWAPNGDVAIAKVRAELRKSSSLPMAYESYKVVRVEGGQR